MEKRINFMKQALCLIAILAFTACGDKNSGDDYSDTYYYLLYDGDSGNPHLDWSTKPTYLRLEFGEDIPKGSEWHLYCSDSWVNIGRTNGKVNSQSENIPITISDNKNSSDREAYIFLDVENGTPTIGSSEVTIHQYCIDSHLEMGVPVSFTTNRSKAESKTLTIEQIKVYQVMDVDWGDGSRNVLTKNDFYSTNNLSISHRYSSDDIYKVTLRFAPENNRNSFNFILRKNQGIDYVNYYYGNSVTVGIDDSQNVVVKFSDDNGFSVDQY